MGKRKWNKTSIDRLFDELREKLGRIPKKQEFENIYGDGITSAMDNGGYNENVGNWTDFLIFRGIMQPRYYKSRHQSKKKGFFSDMKNNSLIDYIKKAHSGKTITELSRSEYQAYKVALSRGLIRTLVRRGILVEKIRSKFFTNISNQELIKYMRKNHRNKTIAELAKDESQAYLCAKNRDLFDELVNKKILRRINVKRNSWKSLDYTLQQASEYVSEYGFDSLSDANLIKTGYSSLGAAIMLKHGGFVVFREKLRDYLQQPTQREQTEGLLEDYVHGS